MKKRSNKKTLGVVAIVVFVLALAGGGSYAIMRKNNASKKVATSTNDSMAGMDMSGMDMSKQMNSSVDALKSLKGDQFDAAFINAMAEHHAGAIEMAKYVVNDGKHQEIRTLGNNIQMDQQKEIDQMKTWAKQWGYSFVEPSDSAIQMMAMTMKGLSGDELDKQFITDMSSHHSGAIDMANLALTNAKHQEIKDFANRIITAQTKEMMDMNNWAMNWSYKLEENANNPHASQ